MVGPRAVPWFVARSMRGWPGWRVLALVACLLAGVGSNPAAAGGQATPLASPVATGSAVAWTQIAPGGTLLARAVVLGDCPTIELDGAPSPMAVRSGAGGNFPDTVCEAPVPAGTRSARIDGRPLALVPDQVRRIAVVGDTGCRVEGDRAQDCDDPAAWPFATVAAQIATWKPDLIVHVGDYVYRESACPAAQPGCAGTPFGDSAATWRADFFAPAASALPAAPWIFVRGNHENCDREGTGWFRYLDAGPMPATCQTFTAPWAATVAGLPFLVMDSSAAGDVKTDPALDVAFGTQLGQLAALTTDGAWLLTHKPIVGGILTLGGKVQTVTDATIQSVARGNVPAGIGVVLAGHIHLAEALLYTPASGKPVQIIAGNGGTLLDAGTSATYSGANLGDPALGAGIVGAAFGWMTVELDGERAVATALDLDGRPQFTVELPTPS